MCSANSSADNVQKRLVLDADCISSVTTFMGPPIWDSWIVHMQRVISRFLQQQEMWFWISGSCTGNLHNSSASDLTVPSVSSISSFLISDDKLASSAGNRKCDLDFGLGYYIHAWVVQFGTDYISVPSVHLQTVILQFLVSSATENVIWNLGAKPVFTFWFLILLVWPLVLFPNVHLQL